MMMLMVFSRSIIFQKLLRQKLFLILISLLSITVLLAILNPDNPLFNRLLNVVQGTDTSARGRTYESFILAHKIVAEKNLFFGIGPGQLKVFGRNIIIQYYSYSNIPEVVRIPNACADTIVCFGYLGLAIRLGIQLLLFYTTKLFKNPFRLWLFLFLFIYQFTGSYITNPVEYMLWALVFAPVFKDFITAASVQKLRP